ncbi:MAG: GTP-binding protein, partial [Erysipelotrichaceae bacterium]|nr:GTP-binding protein [Erysipelotrichaceae bacterium]
MIEVIIVSGFLGAGKTTLIQRLLKNLEYEKIMLIENEFGEVNIDSSLFDSKLRITDINNGCICCSLDGKLDEALEDILKYDIDTLIVEPSGVAELSAIKD